MPRTDTGTAGRVLQCGLGLLLIGALAVDSQAAERLRGNAKSEQNTARLLRQGDDEQAPRPAQPPEREMTLILGLAFERDGGGGHAATTPFNFSYTPTRWYFEVSGDGYTRQRAEGERSRGLADIVLLTNYTYKFGAGKKFALIPEFELSLPTHGEVGSRSTSQTLRLGLGFERKDWTWTLTAGLSRDGEQTPDVSRYTRSLKQKVQYAWPDERYAAAALKRAYQSGSGGKTRLTLEYGFPIGKPEAAGATRQWSGTFIVGHGLASGPRSRSLEFDLGCNF